MLSEHRKEAKDGSRKSDLRKEIDFTVWEERNSGEPASERPRGLAFQEGTREIHRAGGKWISEHLLKQKLSSHKTRISATKNLYLNWFVLNITLIRT